MTIGVGYKTDKYFVCCTDIQTFEDSTSFHYNSCKKIVSLKFGEHHGVLYGSGNVEDFLAGFALTDIAVKKCNAVEKCSLDFFVDTFAQQLCQHATKKEERRIQRTKDRLVAETKTFADEREHKKYCQERLDKLLRKIKNKRKTSELELKFVCYDAHSDTIRAFSIEKELPVEVFDAVVQTGQGSDGSRLYFSLYDNRTDHNKMTVPELLYFVSGAYNCATLLRDVEGTPHICIIDKEQVRLLSFKESAVLANIAAARIAELLPPHKNMVY